VLSAPQRRAPDATGADYSEFAYDRVRWQPSRAAKASLPCAQSSFCSARPSIAHLAFTLAYAYKENKDLVVGGRTYRADFVKMISKTWTSLSCRWQIPTGAHLFWLLTAIACGAGIVLTEIQESAGHLLRIGH
jgi:hypothetical protein